MFSEAISSILCRCRLSSFSMAPNTSGSASARPIPKKPSRAAVERDAGCVMGGSFQNPPAVQDQGGLRRRRGASLYSPSRHDQSVRQDWYNIGGTCDLVRAFHGLVTYATRVGKDPGRGTQ